MAWTAGLIWHEATRDENARRKYGNPPELRERYLWPQWRGQFEDEHEEALKGAGCGALLTIYMTDFSEEQNEWTSPEELAAAATRLKELVARGDETVLPVVELYEFSADDMPPFDEETPLRDLFLAELDVIVKMAEWAKARGLTRIAIEMG